MAGIPIAEGKSVKSGASRRHVGGDSSAAVKPKKSGRPGQSPLHTMYVARNVGVVKARIGRDSCRVRQLWSPLADSAEQ